jgi:hypothetical protein
MECEVVCVQMLTNRQSQVRSIYMLYTHRYMRNKNLYTII